MSEFLDKVVYVSRAAGNLGQAVTKIFLSKGAYVVALDIMDEALKMAYPNISDRISTYGIDLTDPIACKTLFGRLAKEEKIADILCALTGGFAMGDPVHQTPIDILSQMFNLNVLTLVTLSSATVPYMQRKDGGTIITIGANAAVSGLPNMGAYCASKSAVMKLTESMSAELKCNSFTVNCILPKIINTPQNRAAMPDTDPKDGESPENIAELICHLMFDVKKDMRGEMVRAEQIA